MSTQKNVKIIVPDESGAATLSKLENIQTVIVTPDQAIPESDRDAEILVVGPAEQQREVDAALRQIAQLPNLKLLQTLGQGTEQWDGVLPESVGLRTARGAHGGSTAEWAVMALLALTRELPFFINNQKETVWQNKRSATLMGAKILIYGAGDLGENMSSRLEPFGPDITVVAAHAREGVVSTEAAKQLLSTADAVMLALPLTPVTRHMVDSSFLAALPDGCIVINAGRGGLIDQPALVKELEAGRLRAALDVMTPEPLPSEDPLWHTPGVLITPHTAGNTEGADSRAWRCALDQMQDFLQQD